MPAKKRTPKRKNKGQNPPKKPWFARAGFIKSLIVVLLIGMLWVIYLDAQVRYRFEGQRWQLPAQVYARALEIYDGRALNLDNLIQELSLLQYRKTGEVGEVGTYSVSGGRQRARVEIAIRPHQLPGESLGPTHVRFVIDQDVVSQLKVIAGEKRALVTIEPLKFAGIYPAHQEERVLLSYQQLPEQLVQALLATEDRDFFSHWGISPLAIMRAMWENLVAGRVVQGGSTLTQQLVKNFYLTRERSIWRKANEAIMALLLEWHYDKQSILETYANDIYLGQSGATAIHGFAMASEFYFGKPLEYCELHELATLVAIIKGPSYYDPRKHSNRVRERRDLVIRLMQDQGYLTPYQARLAKESAMAPVAKPNIQANRYPAFLDLVKRQLRADYQEQDLRSEGLKIYTTLDPQLQMNLEEAAEKIMPSLPGQGSNLLQLGSVVTGVGTGEVLAILGDRNPRYQGFNRALDADRQIGSLIKPAVTLTALMQPDNYQLPSLVSDDPFKIRFEDGQEWRPRNFDQETHENVSLLEALSRSYNVATARLGLELGLESVHETLRKLGVEDDLNPFPSLFLGAQSLTPIEVSKFYLTLASNGFNMPLRSIREITTAQGQVLQRYPFDIEQVFPASAMHLMQFALQETMRTGTGRGAYRRLPAALHVAGKTGTTNDNRDSWFAGFSGDYLGVVWVGKDNNEGTQLTGSSGALKVWTELMARIPQYPLSRQQPDDVDYFWFDTVSWKRTDDKCPESIAVPVWGQVEKLPYQTCRNQSAVRRWIKGWFD